MIKKLFFTGLLMATTVSFAQTHTITYSAPSVTELVVSENGYLLDKTGPTNFSEVKITVTSTMDFTGVAEPTYDEIFFPFKTDANEHVFKPSIALNDASASTNVLSGEVRTRTWVIGQLILNPAAGAVLPVVGNTINFFTSGGGAGTTQIASTPILIVAPYYGNAITEFNFNTDANFQGFTTHTNATAVVTGGALKITTVAGTTAASVASITTNGIQNSGLTYVDASVSKYAHVYYKNVSANTQFRITYTNTQDPVASNGNNASGITTNMTVGDDYVSQAVYLGNNAAWTGKIYKINLHPRINNTNSAAGDFYIDKIIFSPEAVLSTNSVQKNAASVYPNPTTGLLTISDVSTIKTMTISNVVGQVVKTFGAQSTLDISDLKAGVYILKANNGLQHKIVKN
jgi:hypothetical protein